MNVVDVRVNAVTIQLSSSNLSGTGEYFVNMSVTKGERTEMRCDGGDCRGDDCQI
jgi:hypothetical protein